MSFRADLHCHTNFSDGSLSPEELISHAKEVGLSGLSITDHDSVASYPRAIKAAEKEGVCLGTGVEFSAHEGRYSVHILGYDFDLDHPRIQTLCRTHLERRQNRNRQIAENLKKLNMPVELEVIEEKYGEHHPIGRPHIALALVEKGYVKSTEEAFQKYLGDGKAGFAPGTFISVDETIATIHSAGGKAFIAHPHFMRNQRHISRLLEKPFDGIECYYAKLDPTQEEKWVQIAKKRGLLMSGGSDFHGALKPHIPLGCSWVGEAVFDAIFQRNRWKF